MLNCAFAGSVPGAATLQAVRFRLCSVGRSNRLVTAERGARRHGELGVGSARPERQCAVFGLPSLELEGARHEQWRHTPEVEARERTAAAALQSELLQQRRREWSVHQQIGIPFHIAHERLVIVDAVPITVQ